MVTSVEKYLVILLCISVAPFVPYVVLIPMGILFVLLGMPRLGLFVILMLDIFLAPVGAPWYGHAFWYVLASLPLYHYARYTINV